MRVIRTEPKGNARLRLFCFPYAGGSAAVFRHWHRYLPTDVEVLAIELPGRGRSFDSEPLADLGELVLQLHRAILPYLDRNFAFFGHSMGALLGFELTRALRRSREPLPDLLVPSAFRAPHLPDPTAPLHRLGDDAFVAELVGLGGTPQELVGNRELLDIYLPVLRADFAMVERYRFEPEEPIPVAVCAFGGTEDPHVSRADLADWHQHFSAAFEIRLFPGDHLFIHARERDVLATLAHRLEKLR